MAKGLDVGTMNIVSATPEGDSTRLVQQRNSFVELEYSEVAERILARSDVLYIKNGGRVYILGEDALNFANIFNKTTRRPMQAGILSRQEKSAIPMIKLIVEKVAGTPSRPKEPIYFSSPADPVDSKLTVLYHQKTLQAVLNAQGFDAHPVNEGMAVVYSELADNNFTGMGISFGAGMTNVCLSYSAVPVMTFSIARGGDWIDEQVAAATGLPKDRVTSIKEKDFVLDWSTGLGEAQGAIAIYYENLLDYLVKHLERQVANADIQPDLKVPVVLTGGTSMPKGFPEMFEERLKSASLPFQITTVKRAANPMYSVARGALVAAQADEPVEIPVAAVPSGGASRPTEHELETHEIDY